MGLPARAREAHCTSMFGILVPALIRAYIGHQLHLKRDLSDGQPSCRNFTDSLMGIVGQHLGPGTTWMGRLDFTGHLPYIWSGQDSSSVKEKRAQ